MKAKRLREQHKELIKAVRDDGVAIRYYLADRSYNVFVDQGYAPRPGKGEWIPTEDGTIQFLESSPVAPFYFCPWTGEQLPGDVSDIRDNILKSEYGLTEDQLWEFRFDIPQEFNTEDWWVNRNIGPVELPSHVKELSELVPDDTPYEPDILDVPVGLRRSACRPPHLCKRLFQELRQYKVMYWYLPQTREYGPRVSDHKHPIENQKVRIKPAPFCPWCGRELPKSLRKEWLEELAARGMTEDAPNIPEELSSDLWWKAKGL